MKKNLLKDEGISLYKTPILQEFIRRMLIKNVHNDIVEDFIKDSKLLSRCKCTDNQDKNDISYMNCATVYFKTNPKYEERLSCQGLASSSNDGLVHLYLYKKHLFEIECLIYPKFPFQEEVKRVLNNDFTAPKKEEWDLLNEFFRVFNS